MQHSTIQPCQNCTKNFTIEADDFAFYESIHVPPPTFCPSCRLQRRLSFSNITNLYKRRCDRCGKDNLSIYPPHSPFTVYCPTCWWSDGWDPLSYGQEYDFNQPFFQQFKELMARVPHLGLAIELSAQETSPYTNYAGSVKNCYLVFNAEFDEECINGFYLLHSRSSLDSSFVMNSDEVYDCMHVYKVRNGVGLRDQVTESIDCSFLRDSKNCQNCFGSANLRNKKYYFFNESLTKETYSKKLKELDLGSYATYQQINRKVQDHWSTVPKKGVYIDMSAECSGNMIFQSKHCRDSFELFRCEDGRFLTMLQDTKHSYDITGWAGVENSYESLSVGAQANHILFSALGAIGGNDIEYSFLTISGSHLFGCMSVKKGMYSILNKAYSEKEYMTLTARIREQMKNIPYNDMNGKKYGYGEFFPSELSPFGYNETMAQRLFPLSENEARRLGYQWTTTVALSHTITKHANDLPDNSADVDDTILHEVIDCRTCGRGFRIVPLELHILQSRKLPLPRECPRCRIEHKLEVWLKESQLVDSACTRCNKPIQTPVATQHHKYLFCNSCYNAEIV